MNGDQINPPRKNYLKKAQPYISMCYEQYLTENLRENRKGKTIAAEKTFKSKGDRSES